MCADQSECVSIRFRCETNDILDCKDGSDEKNCNITGRTDGCDVGAAVV